ncbi:hypothetical protein K435DRAFT_295202 [Dendrothele bispora CBS 962.96]|uniref:Uncharacterized protein n=1 Tax=Dendrothele bispora (strain CBS 962.96) TaxID=1314807 RepID=A0A4S8LJA7_DENBC|nr:hypothetical protein K435DRAFT_295202 [Dendrothele bispora CBS 962.96]
MDFQTEVHVSSSACGLLPLLHILQVQNSHTRLRGLSLKIRDGQINLSSLTPKHFVHFPYEINSASSLVTSVGNSPSLPSSSNPTSVLSISSFSLQNHAHLQTQAIEDPFWAFPSTRSVAIQNLTHPKSLGQIPLAATRKIRVTLSSTGRISPQPHSSSSIYSQVPSPPFPTFSISST